MEKTTNNGYFKIKTSDFGDKWLRFSMNCWLNLKNYSNKSVDDIGKAMESGDYFDKITSLSELIYCASMAYDQENGNDIDYNYHNTVNWLSDMEEEDILGLYDALTWSSGGNLKKKMAKGLGKSPKKEQKA